MGQMAPAAAVNGATIEPTANPSAGSPVASTSKVTLDDSAGQDGEKPVFKRRRDKMKRSLSIANGQANGAESVAASANGAVAKRVKTFYDDADDSEDSSDDAKEVATSTQNNGSHGIESKKQARKRQQADKAEHLLNARRGLPVWHAQEAILKEIEARDTVVVLGETGSGKTTRRSIRHIYLDS